MQTSTVNLSSKDTISRISKDDQQYGQCPHSVAKWCGRQIEWLRDGSVKFFTKAKDTFVKSMELLGKVGCDNNTAAILFKRLDRQVLRMCEEFSNAPNYFKKFRSSISNFVGFVDFVQVGEDLNYFFNKNFVRDSKTYIAARVSLAVSNFTGAMLWLGEVGVINLGKAAAAIGNAKVFGFVPKIISSIPGLKDLPKLQQIAKTIGDLRIFSFVPKIPLGTIALRSLSLAYTLFAVDALQKLLQRGANVEQQTYQGLRLSFYLSELLLDVLLTIGMTNPIGLGVVGLTCLTMGVSSFLYEATHSKEINETKKVAA